MARTHAGHAGIGPHSFSTLVGQCSQNQNHGVACGAPWLNQGLMMEQCCDPAMGETCFNGQCFINAGARRAG